MGESLVKGGPLVTVGGPLTKTQIKVKKVVSHWMSWMSILHKKTKTPRKTQKNNNLESSKY